VALVLDTAAKLRQLTRNGPGVLKFYALVAGTAAEFYRLASEDWGLYENWKVHQETGDLWWRAELRVLRANVSRRLLRKYQQSYVWYGFPRRRHTNPSFHSRFFEFWKAQPH
jgi:hypothetical protein